ncbi:ABC transporter substrate-binding protein [Vallitalea guaymasensis]|uniref:ABC transporter substrate-binding protein n=1 Tax=Vallitalea guaymasensis TaxID=1185412 RepID=UPI0023539F8D|nr:sugar ABC transporter substrate-binding protein [Vallitalea guaymasensis]
MKKIVMMVMIVTMILTSLMGCSKEDTPASDNGKKSGTSTSADKKTEKNIVLKFIMTTEGEEEKFINKALEEEFYPDNPNIKVEIETVPFSELDKKIVTAHTGNVVYDIIYTNHPSVGTFADAGIIANLDEYIKESDIDLKNDYNTSFSDSAQYKGSQYAMPYETDTRVLAINKKLFDEAGLEAPKTIEDMLQAAEVLTKDTDGDGKNDQFGMIMDFGNMWYPTYDLGQWLLGNGSHLYIQDGDSYVQEINTQGAKDFLVWAKEMSKYQPEDFVSYDGTKITSSFAQGKVGMFVFGPWHFHDPILIEAKDLEYELITNPVGTKKSGASMGGWHIAMGANSKYKDEVWKVLEFLSNPKINAKTATSIPPIYESYNYPPFNDEKYDIFAEQLKTAEVPNPPIPQLSKVAETWNNYFQRYILDDITLDEALKEASTDIQGILDKK